MSHEMVPKVLRNSWWHVRRLNGTSQVRRVEVINIPATELTFVTNLETIAEEMQDEGFALIDAATVEDAYRRLFVASDGGLPPDVGSRSQWPGERQ